MLFPFIHRTKIFLWKSDKKTKQKKKKKQINKQTNKQTNKQINNITTISIGTTIR